MKKLIFLFVLFVGVQVTAQKKIFKNSDDIKPFSDEISQLFKSDQVKQAFDKMQDYWPIPEDQIIEFKEKSNTDFGMIRTQYGKPIDVVKVKTETIPGVAVRFTYILKYKVSGVRLVYTFYQNQNGWILNQFTWDPDFGKEFR